jgi:uncharacterized protein YwgA
LKNPLISAEKGEIIRLNTIFNKLFDKNIEIESFSDRIKLQKIIYMLKSAGIEFSYNFSWYIRGPYSPDLADTAYRFKENEKNIEQTSYQLSIKEEKVIFRLRSIESLYKDADKAELLASFLYIQNSWDLRGEELIKKLLEKKPRYSKEEIREIEKAWNSIIS